MNARQIVYQRPCPKIIIKDPETGKTVKSKNSGAELEFVAGKNTNLLSYSFTLSINDISGSFSATFYPDYNDGKGNTFSLFDDFEKLQIVEIYEGNGTSSEKPVFCGIIRSKKYVAQTNDSGGHRRISITGTAITGLVSQFYINLDVAACAMTKQLRTQADLINELTINGKKEEEVKYQEKMLKKEKEYEKIEEDFLLRTEKAAEQRKKELTSRYSGIRIGWSLFHSTMDDEMNKYFTVQHAFLYDWIISDEDMKLSDKDYYDGYLRGFFKKFTMSDSSVNPTGKIGDDVIYKSTALLFGLDIGLRIRHRMYFLMTVFDIYFPFGVRFQIYDESAKDKRFDNDEINVTFYSCGVYGGCGLEIAFFKSIGLFMEYNIGYTPVGTNKINVDGHQVYLGVTYRSTSQSCCLPFL